MTKFHSLVKVLAILVVVLATASIASAQATRTWVSGVGDDVNPCSRTAPCKTFAGAISKTARNGEISVLDPGGFGTITITKSITINGTPGAGYGSILAAGTNGVVINITDAADTRKTVRLNWLDINGANTGFDGIRFLNGTSLHIENTVIDGFTGDGVEANFTTGTFARIFMRNVSIRNCVDSGVKLSSTASILLSSLHNVSVTNSGIGVTMGQKSRLTARDCTFGGNNTAGVSHSNADSESTFFHCMFHNNPTGIAAGTGTSRISDNLIYGNVTGISGNVKSWGNNYIDGNTTNGTPVAPNLTQL